MRTLTRITFVLASFALSGAARAQAPLITSWIGTPSATSKIGYFVLDFNDVGPGPEVYTFGWHYEGSQTDSDFIVALQGALNGPGGFEQTGAPGSFISKLGYNNRTKFNDFGGNNSGEPNGFWNLWLGFDGQSWTSAQFGADLVTLSDTPVFTFNPFTNANELSGAQWHGWRWVGDFLIETAQPPRPVFASSAPEPAILPLMALALGTGYLALRRRAPRR